MNFKYLTFFLTLFCCALLPAKSSHMPHHHYSNLTLAGDIFSMALPVAGIISYADDTDSSNVLLPALTVGLVSYSTSELKGLFRHTSLGTRPNGYHSSFPSAHTSYAFIGARLIHKKFGLSYGAVAYSLATLTAISRIDGHYHHTRDVLAGAALALTVDALCEKFSHDFKIKNGHLSLRPYKLTGLALEYRF